MKLVRDNIFETNSSSTHTLILSNRLSNEDYIAKNPTLLISFIDTNDEHYLSSLNEKVSYLVSHIIRNYMYNVISYEDLIDQIKEDWDFKRIERYVKEHFNKEIIFPAKYEGDLEDIVSINHQLICSDLGDLLSDIVTDNRDLLDDILSPSAVIEIGHD